MKFPGRRRGIRDTAGESDADDRRLCSQGLHRRVRREHPRGLRRGPAAGCRRRRARRAPDGRRGAGRPPRRRDPRARRRSPSSAWPTCPPTCRCWPTSWPSATAWWSTSRSRTPRRIPGWDPGEAVAALTAAAIDEAGWTDRVIVSSFQVATLRAVQAADGRLALGALWGFGRRPAGRPSTRRPRPGSGPSTPS